MSQPNTLLFALRSNVLWKCFFPFFFPLCKNALLIFWPLSLSSSRLAAHCIECQCSPIGTDSGDALAPQQETLNLISSLSSHLPSHPQATFPSTAPWRYLVSLCPRVCSVWVQMFIDACMCAYLNTSQCNHIQRVIIMHMDPHRYVPVMLMSSLTR